MPVPDTRLSSGGWVYSDVIETSEMAWGLPGNITGGDAAGLCDGHYMNANSQKAPRVGGASYTGSTDGLSSLGLSDALSVSHWTYGARLAFSFD